MMSPSANCIPLLRPSSYPMLYEEAHLFPSHLLGLHPHVRAFPIDQGRDHPFPPGKLGPGCSGGLDHAAIGSTS